MGKKGKQTMSLTDFLGDAAPRDVLPDRPQNWADEVDGFEEAGGTFAPRREGMFGERREERRERDSGFGGGPEVERDWGSLRDRTAPGGREGPGGFGDRDRSPPRVSMADTTDDWGKAKRDAPGGGGGFGGGPGGFGGGPGGERRFGSGFGDDRRGGGFSDAPLRPPGELPTGPPYTAFFGNLPYELKREDLQDFCSGLAVRDVRITKHLDTGNPKGAYVEFATLDDLKGCLERNGRDLLGRSLRVDVAEGRSGGGGGGREDRFGGGTWGSGSSGFAPAPEMHSGGGGGGGGGYVDDGRSWGERKAETQAGSFGSRPEERGGFDRMPDRGAPPPPPAGGRKKLVLQRRSPEEQAALDAKRAEAANSSQSSLFGGAKPVDTLAREREIEERRAAREEEEKRRKEEEKAKRAEEEAEKQARIDAQLEERRRRREEIENGTATESRGAPKDGEPRKGGRTDDRDRDRGAAARAGGAEPSRADEADQWTRKAPLPPSKPRRERREGAGEKSGERKARPIKPRGEGDSSSGDGWKGKKDSRAKSGDRKEGPGPDGKKVLKREPKAERKSEVVNDDGTVNPRKTAKAIVAERATEVKETEVTNAFALLEAGDE